MELRFGFAHQPGVSEREALPHFPQRNILEAALPRWLSKVLWAKEVEVEPALSTTESSGASLFTSHSSNIIHL